jgi:UDP-glucuronate 4-epimerase
MKVLVTGAGGFIGSSLTDRLISDGYFVRGIDNFNDYYDPEIKRNNLALASSSQNFELIEGDLNFYSDLQGLLEDVDFVFHQAGQPGVRSSWGKDFAGYLRDNVLGTHRLLEACKSISSIKKIVYASSSSIYGSSVMNKNTEDQIPKPISPYGVSKLAAENLCCAYAAEMGLPTISLRYFTVFGPRQRPDMAINRLLKSAINGEVFTLWGDGSFERDFTFIDDVINANLLAANSTTQPGEIFNVGGGNPIKINDLIEKISQITGQEVRVNYEKSRIGDPSLTSADSSKIFKYLGWEKEVALEQGLRAQMLSMGDTGRLIK